VSLYLTEGNIQITNSSISNNGNIIVLCIETEGTQNYYFTYNKNNAEYGVVLATKENFEVLQDDEKV
jgi:hypothetical protein